MFSQRIPNYYALPAIILSTLLAVIVIFAWQEPSSAPPGGNVPAPINVGATTQYKEGGLRIGGAFQSDSTGVFKSGLKIENSPLQEAGVIRWTGTDFQGYSGTSWQSLTAGGFWNSTSTSIYYIGGNVGIGTTTPSGRLQIAGDGLVVGNPTGGNKGAGSINVEKIYVKGSEAKVFSVIEGQRSDTGNWEVLGSLEMIDANGNYYATDGNIYKLVDGRVTKNGQTLGYERITYPQVGGRYLTYLAVNTYCQYCRSKGYLGNQWVAAASGSRCHEVATGCICSWADTDTTQVTWVDCGTHYYYNMRIR